MSNEIKFSMDDVQSFILNGGTVIEKNIGEHCAMVLIRLPKGKFYEAEDGTKFEYIQCDTRKKSDGKIYLYHAVSRNGHIREVKTKSNKSYYENAYYLSRKKAK